MKLKLALAAAIVLLLAAKTPVFGDHAALAGLLSAAVLGVLIWRVLPGSKKASPVLARMDRVEIRTEGGHGTKTAARHEGGHRRYAKARGWHVHYTQINPDGSGVTVVDIPRGATPAERVGMAVSGRVAAGTARGCGSDHAYRDQVLSSVRRSERSKVNRTGESMASRTVGGWIFDGGVGSDAAKLLRKGRING